MPSKNPAQRRSDIVDNIDAIEAFTLGLEFEKLAGDRKTVYAAVRGSGDRVGDVAKVAGGTEGRHPEIDRIAVAAAGNVYRHEYYGADERLIWHTVLYDLDALSLRHFACPYNVRTIS